MTHARVRSGDDGDRLKQFTLYENRTRDLLIYDESLLISDSRSINKVDLDAELGQLRPYVLAATEGGSTRNTKTDTLRYLEDCLGILTDEFTRQATNNRDPSRIKLPYREPEDISKYITALRSQRDTKGRCLSLGNLRHLLEISQADLRVVPFGATAGATVQYDLAVPHELNNIAILDASYPIRDLERLDKSIKTNPNFNGSFKRFDHVQINFLKHGSGRSTMESSFRSDDRKASKEIVEVIKNIPNGEAVLVFTFKQRSPKDIDMRAKLEEDLSAAGVDLNATIKGANGADHPRVVFLTWGSETSLSKFSFCQNVILAGILQRSDHDLSAEMIGQQDDLTVGVDLKGVRDVQLSESAHLVYQALSRGSCRVINNGQAKPMRAWLMHRDSGLKDLLDVVMPGAVWRPWQTKYLTAATSIIEDTAKSIVGYLQGLPEDRLKVSTAMLKREMDLKDIPTGTWKDAVNGARSLAKGWFKEDRSFVRATAGF